MSQYKTLTEACKELDVPYYRIIYAEKLKMIPEPQRLGRQRIYSESDIETMRKHFKGNGDVRN